jgi:BirA family biotin operon repressor/biotin-[acetyl-CoA-carboxylase] ligase
MPNALTFAALRLLSDQQFHLQAELARRLNVSEAMLDSALNGLGPLGVAVARDAQLGCRLTAPIDWLNSAEIEAGLGAHRQTFSLHLVDIAKSTNTALLARAADTPNGTVMAAELQTAGRGRRGRAWHTGLGSALTFSVLWRFDHGAGMLAGLGPAVGIALCRALRELGAAQPSLKWPNDVLVKHQKIAGTLVEIQGDVLGPSVAVIGIGLNCRLDAVTRERIDQAVIDLAGAGISHRRNQVLATLLSHLASVLSDFSAGGFRVLRKEWEALDVYAGKPVVVRLADGSFEQGMAAGVGDDGALLLQTGAGLRRFHSGEVSLRPLAVPVQARFSSGQ